MTFYLTQRGEGYALCREAEAASDGVWHIRICGGEGCGMLHVNGLPRPVRGGRVSLAAEWLREGENALVYTEKNLRYTLEPVRRAGDVICLTPPDPEVLYLRLAEQHQRLAALLTQAEERLAALEKQAAGFPLFS